MAAATADGEPGVGDGGGAAVNQVTATAIGAWLTVQVCGRDGDS